MIHFKDADPLFRKFLKSGAARVLAPVRPGYEKAVLYFLQTGIPWNGGPIPGIDDELYVDILGDALQPVPPNDTVDDTWEIRLPTSLVLLQGDAEALTESGLPCNG